MNKEKIREKFNAVISIFDLQGYQPARMFVDAINRDIAHAWLRVEWKPLGRSHVFRLIDPRTGDKVLEPVTLYHIRPVNESILERYR